MAQPFDELREQLLRAGVAPRHVRRYVRELADHLADLRTEQERAGLSRPAAETAALARLGTMDELARAMIQRPQFRSWCARAPWAMFTVAPLLCLAVAYLFACFYLWCGWNMFLPAADTPFGAPAGPMYGLANLYFQAGKFYYLLAPLVVGWGIAAIAARQRLQAAWPVLAMALVAGMGATAQIHASRSALPGSLGHISMTFFLLTPAAKITSGDAVHALLIFTFAALPYVLWRLRARSLVC